MTFSGTVNSDFMKLVEFPETRKSSLIDFAGTDFDSFRVNLLNYIKAVYPLDYNIFAESDFAGMLVDLVSYVGAATSMKADFLANENYLRTAKNRNNVKKLLELIGVRLKGPISAAANARLTFSPDDNPYGGDSQQLEIPFNSRAVTITSPLDGRPLTYTLYKVVNGLVDQENQESSIILNRLEVANEEETIHENLVLLEGSFVRQTGTFGGGNGIKTIQLPQSPIVEGSVSVFIDGNSETSGVYTQVDNIYFAPTGDSKVFQLISDDSFAGTLVFGDNIAGKSPATTDDYVVTYRIGGGIRGNIGNEIINTEISVIKEDQQEITATLENISIGTGGADAETVERAKKYAGLSFRRQDRLVTLLDFESFVNSFISSYGSIGKSTAAVRRAFSSGNIVDIYILEKASDTQLRKATPTFKQELLQAMEPKKMLTDELVIVDGLVRTLDLVVSLRVDKNIREQEEVIKNQIRALIQSYMSIDNRSFGQEFIPQDLARTIFQNPYVLFATVDNYPDVVKIDFNEIIQLNNLTINIVRV